MVPADQRDDAGQVDDLRRRLFATADAFDAMFDGVSQRAELLGARYQDVRSVLVVGSGGNEGTAQEIALKYDEMAHIPTKGMNPGRHLHGALGLTQPDLLTIVVAPLFSSNTPRNQASGRNCSNWLSSKITSFIVVLQFCDEAVIS